MTELIVLFILNVLVLLYIFFPRKETRKKKSPLSTHFKEDVKRGKKDPRQ